MVMVKARKMTQHIRIALRLRQIAGAICGRKLNQDCFNKYTKDRKRSAIVDDSHSRACLLSCKTGQTGRTRLDRINRYILKAEVAVLKLRLNIALCHGCHIAAIAAGVT